MQTTSAPPHDASTVGATTTTTADDDRPDPSRTGALWVAGTGAFLLFAAAVVFVAVRWSDIPEGAKLAALGAVTAALLVAGRTARTTFPATATALFHLGSFLLPLDVAAALLRAPVATGWVVVATGLTGVIGLGVGARLERSNVLAVGAAASTVVVAAGVGDLLPVAALSTVLPAGAITAWSAVVAVRASRWSGTVADAVVCSAVAVSLVTPVVASIAIAGEVPDTVLLSGLAATAWVLGVALDRTRSDTFPALGDVPRAASVLVLFPAVVVLPSGHTAALALALAGVAWAESVRLDRPLVAMLTAITLPVAVVSGADAIDLAVHEAGLAATLAALVPLGLAGVVTDRWRPPTLVAAVALAAPGVALASLDPAAGASALLVLGVALAAAGWMLGTPVLVPIGAATATYGYWRHLDLAGVEAADAYVAPVVVLLTVIGVQAQRRGSATSWFTLAPPAVLLGGTALVERFDGGGGVHALIAGAVGLVAVGVGGRFRLVGPLVVGTGLLVALATFETLTITAGVPTWAWLAAGGTLLLAVGLAMDRAATGPVETGRRIVDVVGERFT